MLHPMQRMTLPESNALNQQAALAQFGEFALKCHDLDTILHEACRLVGIALSTHLAKVMELQSDGTTLLVRAGVGWKLGVVGKAKVVTGERTAEHYALRTAEPVVSPDIDTEGRFDYPVFIRDNGVQALSTVIIVGPGGWPPYGVLQVDSREKRDFTTDEMLFLRNYANLLAAAVERLRNVAELRDRADEKERLLQELQHRVKNNLQTVMTLVARAVRRAEHPEVVNALRAIGNGVEALRLIHDKMYSMKDGVDRTCLGTYMAELVASLLAFHGKEVEARVRLATEIERIEVASDTAVPFGLIASEFITNSLKYAFGEGAGTIGLRVENIGTAQVRVTLWDDGRGLSNVRSDGTGIKLIEGFARQVGAAVAWTGESGTRLVLLMPALSVVSEPDHTVSH